MATPHLRRLIGREAALPERLAARREAWRRAGVAAAEALSALAGDEATLEGAALNGTSAAAIRAEDAGVVCAMSQGRGFVHLCAADAIRVTDVLLRTTPGGEAEEPADDPLRLLDTLLVRAAVSAIIGAIGKCFPNGLAELDGAPRSDWPLEMAGGAWLRVALRFAVGPLAFKVVLLLPEPHDAFAQDAAAVSAAPALRRAALTAPACLTAEVDRWQVPAGRIRLAVGDVLPLSGASIEALSLRVRTASGDRVVGAGELGTARGARAVRVTSVAAQD